MSSRLLSFFSLKLIKPDQPITLNDIEFPVSTTIVKLHHLQDRWMAGEMEGRILHNQIDNLATG